MMRLRQHIEVLYTRYWILTHKRRGAHVTNAPPLVHYYYIIFVVKFARHRETKAIRETTEKIAEYPYFLSLGGKGGTSLILGITEIF